MDSKITLKAFATNIR